MINWQFFPKSKIVPNQLKDIVVVFENYEESISSNNHSFSSDEVLKRVAGHLEALNFQVERSKKHCDLIKVPVLFGPNGTLEKYFDADAYNANTKTVIEIEAGRAVTNYQFLKDLFQACIMNDVDFLVIAVRKNYRSNPDFQNVITFFDTLFASGRLILPLQGILVIGY